MSAIKKEELEKLEEQFGLNPDDLTYQHRCSRITAYMEGRGEEWAPPEKEKKAKPTTERLSKNHPLFGVPILITPLMKADKNRNLAYNEILGNELEVREVNAGEVIYGAAEDVQRMVGDYEIVREDPTRQVVAKTTFPKIGTEITFRPGVDLVPVVRGNSGRTGYIWSFPTRVIQVGDSLIQLYGLKTLIRQVFPELEEAFKNKVEYIDGFTAAAPIAYTHAVLKKHIREESMAEKAGLGGFDGII